MTSPTCTLLTACTVLILDTDITTEGRDEKVHLYTAWHSPFGFRVWVALLEKGIPFEYHETDPYNKCPELFRVSPRGAIPVIHHKSKLIYESSVCIEYLDEAFPRGPHLMPSDPFDRAYVRFWTDFVHKKIIPRIFGMMVKQDTVDQEKEKEDALNALKEFQDAMLSGGPWFMGEQFTMVDIVLGAFAAIFFCMEHYRGFKVPNDGSFTRYHTWVAAIKARRSFQTVLPSREAIIDDWKHYADGTKNSQLFKSAVKGNVL